VGQACKTQLISEQTYYRWRREYGGMDRQSQAGGADLAQRGAESASETA